MADTENRNSGSAELSQSEAAETNLAATLLQAEAIASGDVQFNIPIDSNDIAKVEIVDLDLVIVGKNGERFVLPQAALQATISPEKSIAKFKGGISLPLADQLKKAGLVKPVEGGSYRIEATSIKPVPGVNDKLGFEFNAGREGDEIKAQEEVEQLAAKVEQISKSLQTASLSKSESADGKGPGEGPGQGPGTGKTTASTAPATLTPGAPPNDNTTKKTEEYTYKVPEQPVQNKPMLVSTNEGKLSNLTFDINKTDFGEVEVRRMLAEKPFQVNVVANAKVQPPDPNSPLPKVSVDLKIQWQPGASKAVLSWQNIEGGLPSGFRVNSQDIIVNPIDILPGTTTIQRIRLSWNAAGDSQTDIPKLKFKLLATFVDANGVTITTTEMQFSYGDFRTLAETSDVDTLYLFARGMSYAINGTADADNVNAGSGHDLIYGYEGDDSLAGAQGDDTMDGGAGADTIDGGSGNDTVSYADYESINNTGVKVQLDSDVNTEGDAAGDTLINIENVIGSSGNDKLIGNSQSNHMRGGAGDDTVSGGDGGADTLDGGTGNNTLSYEQSSAAQGVQIDLQSSTQKGKGGDAEDDVLVISSFKNVIGSKKNDLLTGNSSDNQLSGLNGNDTLAGNEGNDTLKGGDGDDMLTGGEGADVIDGGAGTNLVSYADSKAAVEIDFALNEQKGGDAQGDKLSNIQNVIGSSNNDLIKGDANQNKLEGGSGDDTLAGESGNDTLVGGNGNDTADFENSSNGVRVGLSDDDTLKGTASDGVNTDDLYSIENIKGSIKSDNLTGNAQANLIHGRAGDDVLKGKQGNDTLVGGVGADTLEGGEGADWLYGEDIGSSTQGFGNTVTYENSESAVYVYLGQFLPNSNTRTNTNGGDANGDRLFNIQNLIGSAENDILAGDEFNNRLEGGAGDDTLIGGTDQGNDTFIGGAGKDTMVWMDKANDNEQIRDIKLADIAQLNDKFQSIEVLDFQKDSSISKVYLTAQAVRDIADKNDESEITLKLSSSDSYVIGDNEIYEMSAKKDKLTFYTDISKSTVSAVVHIDQVSSQPPVDVTLQQEASRNIFHADAYKMKNLTLADTSKQVTELKPVSLLQEKPLLVNATASDITPLNPGDDTRVMMELALPGLPGANKVAFSLVANDRLPKGFGFFNGINDETFDVNLKPSIELAADGSNVKRFKLFWNAVPDADEFSGYEFKLVVKFYKDNQEINMSSSRLSDPITFQFADYRKTIDVTSLGDDIKGNPILYLPARGISYSIKGTSGDDNIDAGAGHDSIRGFSGNDSIRGGLGDDTLQGGAGADTLVGGTGNNTANYDDSSVGVEVFLASDTNNNTSTARNGTANGDTLSDINNLIGGINNDWFIGNQNANSLIGAAGNDTLEGGKGADTLDGGDGNDTASYKNAAAGVTVDLKTPNNNSTDELNHAKGDIYINIENIEGSEYADSITGDEKANQLLGGLGNDTLEGGLGADTLDGGAVDANNANNTASYANSLEDKSGGITGVKVNLADASQNAGIYAFRDTYQNIQHVVGTAFEDELFGDIQNNSLSGGLGDDLLSGGAGRDTLHGGAGTDTVSYASVAPGAGIVVSLKTPANNTGDASGDRYVEIENLIGSRNNDTLEGDAATNIIEGGGGDDLFYASGGGDTFKAAASTASSVSYEKINSSVTAYLSADKQSLNAGGAGQDKYTNIIHLTGAVGFANKLVGDTKDNSLTGGASNDTLIGGAGKDTLVGGGGTDLVSYEDADDGKGVTLNLITGGISGNAEGDQYSGIENVDGTAYDDQITGNEIANYLRGLAGNDVLIGGGGSDTLDGGEGDDILKNSGSGNHTYIGGAGSNTVSYELVTKGNGVNVDLSKTSGNSNGDNGNEIFQLIQHLVGSKLNDRLFGDDEKNNLSGGDGNDYLDGRAGVDSLSGGQGNDTLIGGAGADTLEGGEGTDTASYDTSTQAVVIDLTGQNASGTTASNDALNDQFENIEIILASQLNDTIIVGSKKTDYRYDGGMGIDTIDFQYSTEAVNVLLKDHTFGGGSGASGGFADKAKFQNIENIVGTNYNDTLGGDDSVNTIGGGEGDDMVFVSLGNDTLRGDAGKDTINFSEISTAVDIKLSQTEVFFTAENKTYKQVYSGFENAVGSKYSDRITGDSSANLLSGDGGNDTFKGEGGADTLKGDAGDDYFYSGDTVTSVSTTIIGGDGSDTVDYTSSRLDKQNISVNLQTGQAISGTLFTDTLETVENVLFNSGNDTFIGSVTTGVNSSVEGGWGNDTLTGGVGNDVLYGDKKDDSTSTDNSITYNDVLDGGAGDDSLFGGQGDDSFKSSTGADVFNGGVDADELSFANVRLANANDLLKIDTANSTKGSGVGTDEALGDVIGQDIETIIGADNHDTVFYSIGRDNLTLFHGNASRSNTVDYSLIALSDPTQRLDYAAFTGLQTSYPSFYIFGANLTPVSGSTVGSGSGKALNDRYQGIKHINGSIYNDSLQGDINNNSLSGGDGNDLLVVTAGIDTLAGGSGIDLLSFESISDAQTVTLDPSGNGSYTMTGGTVGTVNYSGIEGLVGGAGNDSLTGNDDNNYLQGNDGNDSLTGGGGNDTLNGGAGNDTLDGGAGLLDVADYSAWTESTTADLRSTVFGGDTLRNIEKVVGSFTKSNTFIGTSDSTSTIYNEILVGGSKGDIFHGSLGADSYYGGAGADELNYQGGANGVNSSRSNRGIDMSVDSLYCNQAGTRLDTLNKFVIRGDGVPTNKSVITWQSKADLASMESGVSELRITHVSSSSLTPNQGTIDKMYTKITGYNSNTVTGVNSGTDDYAGDKFYNIEILRGTDYNDKVTMTAQSNWGFTFRSNNGQDSMYGGDGNDVLNFRKTSGTTYGQALEGNTLVGGLGADSFILNERDMFNAAGTIARNFNVYGDRVSGEVDTPVFQLNSNRTGLSNSDSYVDEIQIYATAPVVSGTQTTLNLNPFINNIHSVERIDVSRDSVKTKVLLSSALIQGLADNGNNSTIILRLKNQDDIYEIQSGHFIQETVITQINNIGNKTVTFKDGSGPSANTLATAYIEYV
jgi:Ca2+-binding RTX toxin-like protein